MHSWQTVGNTMHSWQAVSVLCMPTEVRCNRAGRRAHMRLQGGTATAARALVMDTHSSIDDRIIGQ